ncbi:MAG: hypothetical protein R8K48_07685 [Gallionella sp.]
MVEILIFLLGAVGALVVTGYSVHMIVGGLVSAERENEIIFVVCSILVCAMIYMAWDVVQRRTGRK